MVSFYRVRSFMPSHFVALRKAGEQPCKPGYEAGNDEAHLKRQISKI